MNNGIHKRNHPLVYHRPRIGHLAQSFIIQIESGFYVACGFEILLNANFTKSSHVITIGT